MNKDNYNNEFFKLHKKRVHTPTSEIDMSVFELPRKKFISEESFANDMAAMSLNPTISRNYIDNIQNQYNEYPYYPTQQTQYYLGQDPSLKNNNNVIRIDNIDEFLSDEENDQNGIDDSSYMDVDTNLIVAGALPLELKPGDTKPKIPDFVINNSYLTDPRDQWAIENIMKSCNHNHHPQIDGK